jgi:hypothetical protein
VSAPETQTFRDLRQRHRAQTRLVREQARQLRGFEDRERRMRAQIEGLPEPGLKAVADVVRRRGDLSMAEALSLVAEVFNGDE